VATTRAARGERGSVERLKAILGRGEGETTIPAPRNRRHWVAVCYDVPDDKRRTKIMKTLEGYGHRVQYSVFECEVRPADLDKLKAALRKLIQAEEDDIRFYDLCETCQGKVTMLGKAHMHRQRSSVVV
jgi:CRISPR-associated protein Cas2